MSARFLLVPLFVVTACTGGATPTPEPTATPIATPSPAPTPLPTPRPTQPDDATTKLIRDIAGTEQSTTGSRLNEVWSGILADVELPADHTYAPPSGAQPYYPAEVPDTTCAAGYNPNFWKDNAFYCAADGQILYNDTWLRDMASRAGGFAPAAVMAHEWGHHVQSLIGVTGYSIQTELQADCFAGMYLANATDSFPGAISDEAELAAALAAFFELGSDHYRASEWFQAGEHGSPQQRIRAFGTGYTASFKNPDLPPPVGKGFGMCNGYSSFTARDFGEIPPYRLLNLPGRLETEVDGTYVIEPEDVLGVPMSTVLLEWLEGDTADEIIAGLDARLPGLERFGDQIDLTPSVTPGSGFATGFQQPVSAAPDGLRVGVLGLVQPQAGGGFLLVAVYRDDPPLVEEDAQRMLAEQVGTLYEVLARLCGPDDSDVIGAPNQKLICRDDQ